MGLGSRMRALAVIGCIGLVAALAGCGQNRAPRLPAGCTAGPLAFERALERSAPGPVRVQGTPISGCFTRNASSDDVQLVGTYLLTAAQELEDRAQQGDRNAAVGLGYLIGAAQRGAKSNGVSSELIRRLAVETDVGPSMHAAFNRGLRAGLKQG